MSIKREWATPLTIGAFFLMAVTGVLMFFHLETGLGKEAHEWLGWALVAGVALHVVVNLVSFKRHMTQGNGRWIIVGFVIVTFAALMTPGESSEKGGDPVKQLIQLTMKAPLSQVAAMTGKDAAQLQQALAAKGFKISSASQSISDIAGEDREERFEALKVVLEQ